MRHACHDMQRLAQWALQDKLETCTCMQACSRARRILRTGAGSDHVFGGRGARSRGLAHGVCRAIILTVL